MRGVVTSRDDIPLAFEAHGAGAPAVVLVHGWSCDRSYWNGQVGPLAARYRTVAVDLAGHGESGSGRRAWTMAAFGEDVVAVVEHLGAGPVVLVGHSMGGDVSAATPEIAVEALRHAVGNEPGVIAGLARLTVRSSPSTPSRATPTPRPSGATAWSRCSCPGSATSS